MHTIRNNCIYEFVKLCLRYTARDPRLRSDVWSENSRNNCGELTGGHIRSIFKSIFLANAQRKPIQTGSLGLCVIVSQEQQQEQPQQQQHHRRLKDTVVQIDRLYNQKELSFN
ncbi:hypothetical protein HA402_015881 [Bradysia odoriphaga]|nr:hypothetical protein HA402_015881 [Bradysia odoriphaga]